MAENLTYYDSPLTGEELDAAFRKIPTIDASVEAAANSATQAQSWTKGGTGTREGEDTNNAQYWCGKAQEVANGSLGWYTDTAALKAAHPTGKTGQWAILGATDTVWVWSTEAGAWVETGGARLYKATFLVDGWSSSGPYTQTVAVTPVDGGPPVSSGSTLLACIGIDSTLPQDAKDAMAGPAADIAGAEKNLGDGTISVTLENSPDVDVELYFYIKQGGTADVPSLDPISTPTHRLTLIGKATANKTVSVPAGKYSEFVVFVYFGTRGAYTSFCIPAEEIIGNRNLVSGGYWEDTNAYGSFLNMKISGEAIIFSLASASYGGTEYASSASISVYGRV